MNKIKNKMMLSILPSVIFLLVGLTIIIANYIYNKEQENQYNRNLLTAKNFASEIEAFIKRYNAIAETLVDSQINYHNQQREDVTQLLKDIADKDKNILGAWVIYEPNQFDGRDKDFIKRKGHDATGRFAPYWNRLKGNLVIEPVMDIDISDWYVIPKKTKKLFITTPFIYDNVLMMSFCYPILQKDSLRGVGGLDISMETIKAQLKKFEDKKLYQSNYAILISNDGTLISASSNAFDDSIVKKKKIQDVESVLNLEYSLLVKDLNLRKEGYLKTKDLFTKEDVVLFYYPIQSGNLGIIVSISKKDLLSNTIKAIYILISISTISVFAIGSLLYFLIHTIVKPLLELTEVVIKFGKHDFSQRAEVSTKDEIGELATNFNMLADSIEDYSNKLEDKVKKRTEELNNSLQEITRLKYQQDGDYFLTSILLNPFYKKITGTKNFKIHFLIEQKKKFEFNKRKLSIGGDLCYTDLIELRGKSYIVFINADAMGKSMQGAGGALVLGSVLSATLERTKSIKSYQDSSPEEWVKNAFIDLHKTFETFDGLMLVSVVFGVIEENSKIMYYINAEHPFVVLYRDNKASFIDDSLSLRKLGTPFMKGKLSVRAFQLNSHDSIIIGSDGKDDLVLSVDITGKRIINEDESLFLKIVEESGASLEAIYKNLAQKGELIDDLSLLKIESL